jgi:hypothetical protein
LSKKIRRGKVCGLSARRPNAAGQISSMGPAPALLRSKSTCRAESRRLSSGGFNVRTFPRDHPARASRAVAALGRWLAGLIPISGHNRGTILVCRTLP